LWHELLYFVQVFSGKRNLVVAVFQEKESTEKNAQFVPVNTLPGNIVLCASNSIAGGCSSWMQDMG